MVTTKKIYPKKSTKATPTSKKRAKAAPPTWRFFAVSIGIFLVAVATVIVIALFASHYFVTNINQARLDRINNIYTSLRLDDTYTVEKTNVFGDKRVYSYDKGRSFSSEIDYIRGDTVSNTVAQLDAKIKAAGFMFFDEPYPGTPEIQYHYKSSNGEYIRLTVASKPYLDAQLNASIMKQDTAAATRSLNKNAGPTRIIIKVNLDDNNE